VKRARGFTLIELVVVTATMVSVGGTFLTVASTLHREERLSAACAEDVREVTLAARALEDAVHRARRPEDVDAELVGRELRVDGRRVARNVAAFSIAWRDRRASIRLVLAPRSDAPHRREAALELVVFRRPHEGSR
jgi:hypothetical protein